MRFLFPLYASNKVVENVKVALARRGRLTHSRSFKVVFYRLDSVQPSTIVELQLGIVAETRSVVIADSMGVAK